MSDRALLSIMGILEAATGMTLLIAPAVLVGLLLGVVPGDAAGLVVSQVAGAALLARGVACWLARGGGTKGVMTAALIYNVAVALVLLGGWYGQSLSGIAFWPAITVHITLAIWCLFSLSRKSVDQVRL